VDALRADLDHCLAHDNTERPHLGYRNRAQRPLDTITAYLNVQHEGE